MSERVEFEAWAVIGSDGDAFIEDHDVPWFTKDEDLARAEARVQSRFEQFLAKPVRVRVTVEIIEPATDRAGEAE